jgi:hypothetical protein
MLQIFLDGVQRLVNNLLDVTEGLLNDVTDLAISTVTSTENAAFVVVESLVVGLIGSLNNLVGGVDAL